MNKIRKFIQFIIQIPHTSIITCIDINMDRCACVCVHVEVCALSITNPI